MPQACQNYISIVNELKLIKNALTHLNVIEISFRVRGNQDKNRIMNSLGVGSIEHESEMTRIAKIEELIKLEKDCAKKANWIKFLFTFSNTLFK